MIAALVTDHFSALAKLEGPPSQGWYLPRTRGTIQSTAAMLVGLMINYHDARMTDNKLPRCQMTATPVTGISTKCQCRDQNSGSPRVHGPGIKEVKWSVEVQGKARGSLGQGPLLLGGITTPPSTTPPPPWHANLPLPDMPLSAYPPWLLEPAVGSEGHLPRGPYSWGGSYHSSLYFPPYKTCHPLPTP